MIYDIDDYEFTHHRRAHILGPIQIDTECMCDNIARSYWQPEHDIDFRTTQQKQRDEIEQRLRKKRSSLIHCEDELYKIRGTFHNVRKHYLQKQIDTLTREIELAESIIEQYE